MTRHDHIQLPAVHRAARPLSDLVRLEAPEMRRLGNMFALLGVMTALAVGCGDPQPPINRVGVNVVEKSAFEGSWYMHRTVIDMEYEGAPLDFVGDNAGDGTGGFLGFSIPRVRWVIDENFLYAYRDYEIVGNTDDPFEVRGEEDENFLGQPVAAFRIQSHFDIRRTYNSVTGEEQNVIVENTNDRHWYERQFMRVDWSQNLIAGYFGVGFNLSELFGEVERDSASMFVQDESQFPREWRPQFHFMNCTSATDTECDPNDRDWASDYAEGTLYSMSFVTQEILTPGSMPYGFPLCRWNEEIEESFPSAPECASVAIWVRTSFLRVSDRREYEPVGWTNDRFNRAGYFALDRPTYDRSSEAGDPSFGFTDFTNQSANRHNIWRQWYEHDAGPDGMVGTGDDIVRRDAEDRPIPLPYAEREVRPIVWYASSELPAHLMKPSYELVGQWNTVFMTTVRQLRGEPVPTYPAQRCQTEDPGGYCFCQTDPDNPGTILNEMCPGQYDPFESPADASARGVTNPFDCYVANAAGAEPDWNDQGLSDSDFNRWFDTRMEGAECVNILRANTCNQSNRDQWGELDCQQRGDIRFKLLSFVDQPGTPFLGVAQLRGDPITGEILVGDANIGGPAMNSQRTRAMEAYDLINGNITEGEYYSGEDVRAFLNALEHVELPAPPRIDFNAAMRLGVAFDPNGRAAIDGVMTRAMERAELLQGPDGRAAVMSDRLHRLAGSDIERRLVSGLDAYAMANMDFMPEGASETSISDEVLERASPFRNNILDRMHETGDYHTRLGLANMILPNEYTDNSVLSFVNEHRDWSRVRVEFELDRRLYRDTQVHEMGHCLGLRHHFGGTADPHNYFDGYYTINEQFPLPDPNSTTFNADGVPGLSPTEQITYENAYRTATRLRELAGIDQWMNSSVMDYTPNWYQRINGAGRHDHMAISFGYGDVVDIYHNVANADGTTRPARPVEEIHPVNTQRVGIKYYHGGESCETEDDCPFSRTGSRRSELLQSNLDSGITQRCLPAPRTTGLSTCSSFDVDARELASTAGPSPEWVPVEYFYCEDIRASTRTLPGCATFDEGDSFRSIVQSAIEAYERDYIFAAFRRYRRTFSVGSYFGRIFRFVDPLLTNYQNLVYRYAADPEFRNQTGPFGFVDEFLATADTMNFFARMLAQPSIGSYQYNQAWRRYDLYNLDIQPNAQISVPFGQGRFLNSVYQEGLNGLWRVERVGSIYDSIVAMQLMTARGIGPYYGPDIVFQTNFYDIFPNELQQIFTGMISGRPEDFMPRVQCSGGTFPNCTNPRVLYMDFYRGDCTIDPATGSPDPAKCRPHPTEETYAPYDLASGVPPTIDDVHVLSGGTRGFLQNYAAIYSLAEFPIYYDTTFQNQMFICVEGQGDCNQSDASAVEYGTEPHTGCDVNGVCGGPTEDPDFIRYTSRRFGKTFVAWQVDAAEGVAEQTSIAFAMVQEARDSEFKLRMLRTYRGDFEPGDPAASEAFLTAAEIAELQRLDYYPLPTSNTAIESEISRLDGRVQDLEAFFFYLVQLQQWYGIQFPFLYTRPEI